MSDDLFSRLFELFNQPGPVNWKLAGEVARHLAGDQEAIDPFAAEEQRELVRLAEYRLEGETVRGKTASKCCGRGYQWVDESCPGSLPG